MERFLNGETEAQSGNHTQESSFEIFPMYDSLSNNPPLKPLHITRTIQTILFSPPEILANTKQQYSKILLTPPSRVNSINDGRTWQM